MKRILFLLCSLMFLFSLAACSGSMEKQRFVDSSDPVEEESWKQADGRKIRITAKEGNEIVFQLNGSPAAKAFYNQLPLSIEVEDYAGTEKIFYPPEALDIGETPPAEGPAGTLAYYAPWENVAVFYGECEGVSGLYELGEAVSGTKWIGALSGEIQIGVVDTIEKSISQESDREISPKENTEMKINVKIGATGFSAVLEDNDAAKSFMELMKTAPVVLQMKDYSGFEKVGFLGTSLPSRNSRTTTQSGDIVLYNGNQIVIFYGSNSWSYTRLGKIDDLTGWREALGSGDVTAVFSVD